MEFGASGTTEYEKGGSGGRPPESDGGYPGRDLHLRDVLSVRTDRCAGRCKGEDGPSEKPQKIGCYVQRCAVICAVTEDVNLSLEGWQPSY